MSWAKDKDRIKTNYKKLVEYKKKLRCTHCGVRDHRVKKEIDKCIPLCSNCHRIHHSEEVA
jgi:transcription elongation factor Elf1